jgi:hypothetical protein
MADNMMGPEAPYDMEALEAPEASGVLAEPDKPVRPKTSVVMCQPILAKMPAMQVAVSSWQ